MSPVERWSRIRCQINYIFVPNTYRVSTWPSIGAVLQLLSLICLPYKLSILAPILLLFQRAVAAARDARHIYSGPFSNVRRGRWITELQPPQKSGDTNGDSDGVVMFILGARKPSSRPQGRMPANALELNKLYKVMWEEAEINRIKWGCKYNLASTSTFTNVFDKEGSTFIWLSSWTELDGLHEFARHAVHRAGQEAHAGERKFTYIGIMHETYFARRNSTECLYNNFPPLE
ncbi:hypothetical protein K469DRAFT_667802 [Zopfia rhizophila CBS 207.26]|uniref:Uncharacterized protein n=1 Tax=Zopfia rhizophila CBS 207.26 TaxID=1314779 RepID=A0A6A6DWF1_9PEZI|nr:hypothetical protein K469DRAFT_667802 [Zopfia rhizophila CBS 207.26]